MNIIKVKDNQEAGLKAADIIKELINYKTNLILGLATGSSPISTYNRLIEMNKNEDISFKDVMTFNLDEYVGLNDEDEQSYRYFMNNQLFNHVDIDLNNTFIPSGINLTNPEKYDNEINQRGGIDLQLLGLGVNGHIGFNEPGTSFDSLTSIVNLTDSTIKANARFFDDIKNVPTQAVSMGLHTIMQAKSILLIATGANKAEAVYQLVKSEISVEWPCTILQKHNNITIIIDEQAAKLL